MSKPVVRSLRKHGTEEHHAWRFHCPGCGFGHSFDSRWTFNGDTVKPTFTPSLLVRTERLEGEKRVPVLCHSFVTDGQIRFLNDCTHDLAGKTVPLEPIE